MRKVRKGEIAEILIYLKDRLAGELLRDEIVCINEACNVLTGWGKKHLQRVV